MDDGKTLDYAHKVGFEVSLKLIKKKYTLIRFKYSDGKVKMEVVHDGMQVVDKEKVVDGQKFIANIKIIQ
jgi:hypothetical protein